MGANISLMPSFCPLVTAQLRNFLMSAAFDDFCATIAQAKVQIGYADFAAFCFGSGSSTENALSLGLTFLIAAAACRICLMPGRTYRPARFLILAILKWFLIE